MQCQSSLYIHIVNLQGKGKGNFFCTLHHILIELGEVKAELDKKMKEKTREQEWEFSLKDLRLLCVFQ